MKETELHSDIHLEVVPRCRFAFQALYDLYIVRFTRHSSCLRVVLSLLIRVVKNVKANLWWALGMCLFTIVSSAFGWSVQDMDDYCVQKTCPWLLDLQSSLLNSSKLCSLNEPSTINRQTDLS